MSEHEMMAAAIAAFEAAVEHERENFRRWPRLDGNGHLLEPDPYTTDAACRDDWAMCCQERRAAEGRLMECGLALRAKREAA